ncbi:MAG: glycosyltransferase family 9 protein [Sphingobacteriaceae bacterium]
MPQSAKILVLRFSAMGDVAMTAPVLQELLANYPSTSLVVVSRKTFEPFFFGIPNIEFHAFDPKNTHKGFLGIYRLFKELKGYKAIALADLHQNLRSKLLRSLFWFTGISIASLDKGRAEKKALTRKKNKQFAQLKPTTQRYADVFTALGFPFSLKNTLKKKPETLSNKILALSGTKGSKKWIGVAPFAQHAQKVYPLSKMENVLAALAKQGHHVFVFGGGKEEQKIAENWAKNKSNLTSLIGKLNLIEELSLISNLDVMLSMDSSGMHLASLKGIPVVSVWGATHPQAGFLGYGQSLTSCVHLDLACRPCSVYGNKACHRGDFACMNQLSESLIVQKVLDTIS